MRCEMLINARQREESRVAIVEDGILEELYIERTNADNYVGNIYKGRVVNLEPSIQAVFVDFGVGRNGFLHISDVEPQYFRQGGFDIDEIMSGGIPGAEDLDDDSFEDDDPRDRGRSRGHGRSGDRDGERPDRRGGRSAGRTGGDRTGGDRTGGDRNGGDRNGGDRNGGDRNGRGNRRRSRPGARPRFKPPIQEVFRRGDEVLVQVIKEGLGSKGPTLSTYISIPGRYLVLMPALGRVGVSRKIEDEDIRRNLREILLDLNPPKGLGFIIRTAGVERTRKDLSRDLNYLLRLWRVIVKRLQQPAPIDIYEESDMVVRTIRDIFTAEVDEIYVDDADAFRRAKDFLDLVMPKYAERLRLYEDHDPLFQRYQIEDEIGRIHQREVPLKQGGSIVIDQTEALVAIDVNSGNFRADNADAEDTAYQMNLLAAKEIARQLRLRDLGGVVVNDFIDMRKEKHRRGVERALREAVKRDRARTKILRTSPFGLVEMTRQRIRPSLKRSVFRDCPCCHGTGQVKTAESMAIEVLRTLGGVCAEADLARVAVTVAEEVASYLNNNKRQEIARLEANGNVNVSILGANHVTPEYLSIECWDPGGREMKVSY